VSGAPDPRLAGLLARAALIALIGLLVVPNAALSAFVERFRDWSLYVHEDANTRICFIVSTPIKQEGTFSRRNQPRLFVTQFGGDNPRQEVSVDPGYTYRKGSTVEAVVGGSRFELFTDRDRAWAVDAAEDARLIEAMRRGNQIQFRGTSVRDTWSLDTYSLAGFTAAHRAMIEACRNAPKR
jgi:hypothetical protein